MRDAIIIPVTLDGRFDGDDFILANQSQGFKVSKDGAIPSSHFSIKASGHLVIQDTIMEFDDGYFSGWVVSEFVITEYKLDGV